VTTTSERGEEKKIREESIRERFRPRVEGGPKKGGKVTKSTKRPIGKKKGGPRKKGFTVALAQDKG